MKKDRLLELAGVQLDEEFTVKDWDKAILLLADMIMDMAKEDAKGAENEEDEFANNIEQYSRDAAESLQSQISQLARKKYGGENETK